MNILDRIKMAITGVTSNKFRSFLTLLGIIIGVGAVILMVSLGSGTRAVVSGQFSEMQTRQIYLSSNYNLPYSLRGELVLDDENYLKNSSPDINTVTPFYRNFTEIEYKSKETDRIQIGGVRENVNDLTNMDIKYGRKLNKDDISSKKRVGLIGESVIETLDSNLKVEEFVGEEIKIDGYSVLIVGVLKRSNSTVGFGNDVVFIPNTTFRDFWRYRGQTVDFFLIEYDENSTEKNVISQLNYLLDRKYGRANGESRFSIEGLQGTVDIANQVFTVLTYVLAGIAAISLFVGGIGVMNIMLVSIKERTKEIGLRMAIGATASDIRQQFLFEAIILTISGGIIGILIGSGLSLIANIVIQNFFEWWQGVIPGWIILISFAVTVSIGLIFGYYPAYKASKLDPIKALRYE